MIIVEGPDSSGKTTLIKKLAKDFDYLLVTKNIQGPPRNIEDLVENCKVLTRVEGNIIIDRYPTISEIIYGSICRGKNLWDDFKSMYTFYDDLLRKEVIIYCRPPKELLLRFEGHQIKGYDTEEHLNQLKNNAERLVDAYDVVISNYKNVVTYDYTQPGSYDQLINILKEKYNECK